MASGIEAGIVGGAAMLGMLISDSLWSGHVWWEVPNLLGSTFYGTRAFRTGAGLSTLSGAALHFVITGTLGGLFGLACGGIHQRGRLVLIGMLAAVGWYNVANAAFWPRVNPWVPLASPRPGTMFSHILLGACLGYMGQRQRTSETASQSFPLELGPPQQVPAATSRIESSEVVFAGSSDASPIEDSGLLFTEAPDASLAGDSGATLAESPGATLAGSPGPSLAGSSGPSLAGSSGPAASAAPDALE